LIFVEITTINSTLLDLQQGGADVTPTWINPGHVAAAEFSGTSAGNQDQIVTIANSFYC
jgi:hypothetical protein